ncbi:39S ribosomal protein L41, mitochondrial [Talpa occidentalis]|uniref:39S ribosomal protein L41, mitochondrial n=1 Tax=Talpa occidentalis TaxID=50954 RepID=UPI00188FC664|nr:39S ribosomal protein L41, mitochondrial [Talpa occidentalis]
MGLLSAAARVLLRGADRGSRWTSKRGPRSHYKGRGAKGTGVRGRDGRFVLVPAMVPELVVPELAGCRLRPYVSYRAPAGEDAPLTAERLFQQAAAPAIERDLRDGAFDPERLDKYGFEPSQDGKLFQLYPKNFPR